MTTHILSMTYQPKIEGVRNGTIRQTIRRFNPKRPFKVGDKLLIHGWAGRMYHSSWSWRIEAVITAEMKIICASSGFQVDMSHGGFVRRWDSVDAAFLAQSDGIEPANGLELKNVLERYHGKFTDKPVRFQVIRW